MSSFLVGAFAESRLPWFVPSLLVGVFETGVPLWSWKKALLSSVGPPSWLPMRPLLKPRRALQSTRALRPARTRPTSRASSPS